MKEFLKMLNDQEYTQKRMNLIHVLYDLLKDLADMDSNMDMYARILQAAREAIPVAEAGSILIKKNGLLEYVASFGLNHEYLQQVKYNEEETLLYLRTEGKMDRAIIIEDFTRMNQKNLSQTNRALLEKANAFKLMSSISVPFFSNQTMIGGIHLDSTKPHTFKDEDIDVLQMFAFELARMMKMVESIEEKNYLLRYDDMTDIFNRRHCVELIKKLILDQTPFILVSLDLDNLKIVNDSLGHEMGNEYIKHFVEVIKALITSEVIFSRYGGDEFILVFPENNESVVMDLMREARRIFMKQGRFRKAISLVPSFSYGIASFPQEVKDFDGIIRQADQRMYRYKKTYKENEKSAGLST